MRVLVLQLKRIGDLLLTTPALSLLRERFPEAYVTVLIDSSAAELAEALPADDVLARGRPGFWRAAAGHDLCLDFTGTDRSALLAAFSRADRRLTFARFSKHWPRRLAWNEFVDSSVRSRHTADHYADLLEPLGAAGTGRPITLRIPDSCAAKAREILAAANISGPIGVIHAGTARPEKYWLPERWAALGRRLMECGLTPVLTGSADPGERAHLASIREGCPGARDLSGRTSLPELAAVIGHARIFCGVDTAAMHLADAMGTPCLALFGPTNPFHWMPRHAPCRVLRARTTGPFTAAQKGGPMEALTLGEALEGMLGLLPATF